MKRTEISRKPSRRKLDFDREYAAALPGVLSLGCEFLDYSIPAVRQGIQPPPGVPHDLTRCAGRLVGHHAKGRQVRDANNPDNLRCLCDKHHKFVHSNPEWAREVGLMISRLT